MFVSLGSSSNLSFSRHQELNVFYLFLLAQAFSLLAQAVSTCFACSSFVCLFRPQKLFLLFSPRFLFLLLLAAQAFSSFFFSPLVFCRLTALWLGCEGLKRRPSVRGKKKSAWNARRKRLPAGKEFVHILCCPVTYAYAQYAPFFLGGGWRSPATEFFFSHFRLRGKQRGPWVHDGACLNPG